MRDGMFQKNSRDTGHFHSNWLSMMYPRLFLAKNLLRDDGVIFVSIDDNEMHNLINVMNEIFGEENYISNIVWEKRFTRSNNAKLFATLTENVLCYRKSSVLDVLREPRNEKADSIYENPDNDPRGAWTSVSYVNPATKKQRPNLVYPIKNPHTGKDVNHPTNAWKYEIEVFKKHASENRLYWGKNGKNTYPRLKRFLSEMDSGMVPVNFWSRKEAGTTDEGSKELESLLGGRFFDFPKPHTLIKRAIKIGMNHDGIILDFFSGTSPTAQAVFEANKEDGGNRRFILVQLPEPCSKDSEAHVKGFRTISDIGKQRIREAGRRLKNDTNKKNNDLGFKVYKIDESNFKIWQSGYSSAKELENQMKMFVDNVQKGSGREDILYELILKSGRDLNASVQEKSWKKKKYFSVDSGQLIVILEDSLTRDFIDHIIEENPQKVICLDSAFAGNDQLKTNTHLQLESAKIDFKVI